ncbi:Transcriptional regulator, TetR family [metagenome]|uniref:Transcriptional regulator, TetR family n=1 Tax=metagenome TaxID=256318 RepID=A0A2P2C155_9ZZZZ
MTSRRDELAHAATDWALEHGLIGLSLRPLAADLGTSDRMLLYHFGDKDQLIAAMLRVSVDWSVSTLHAMPPAPDVRAAVVALWAVMTSERMDRCQRMYVEAAALGLLGREPYASVVGEANERWTEALADQLVAAGSSEELARRAVVLMDAAFMGFQLDLPLDAGDPVVEVAVQDLADAVVAITGSGQGSA